MRFPLEATFTCTCCKKDFINHIEERCEVGDKVLTFCPHCHSSGLVPIKSIIRDWRIA